MIIRFEWIGLDQEPGMEEEEKSKWIEKNELIPIYRFIKHQQDIF